MTHTRKNLKDLAHRIEAHSTTEWDDNECWLCDRATTPRGYVPLTHTFNGVETRRYQHVIAWEMHNAQPVPEGMVVMHSCDNPGCFNPAHLSIGTQSENIRDSVAKRRHSSLLPTSRYRRQ